MVTPFVWGRQRFGYYRRLGRQLSTIVAVTATALIALVWPVR